MILLIKTDVVYPLFLYANGLMPTYRLKYLPKNDVLAKLSELEISWMGILVDFSCDLASIITMCEMISTQVFPVTFLTVVQR